MLLPPLQKFLALTFPPLRLAVSYKDLRSIPEFMDKTVLAVKAPQDTILNCDVQEVSFLLAIASSPQDLSVHMYRHL